MNVITVNDLTKIYSSGVKKNSVTALNNLTLNVSNSSIFGLLGPNGAGKTTLVKLLLGITFSTSGDARLFDNPVSNFHIKKKVGYLPENHKYPSYLTGEQVLKFFGKLSGVDNSKLPKRIDELLDLVKLSDRKKSKVKTYSKGMMQRLGLAQALINDPELIFLDEPTDGVDPIGRKEIRDILLHLKEQSKTIFLNSHLLSEVEMITDRVGILNKGKLIREGTVKELTEKGDEYKIRISEVDRVKQSAILNNTVHTINSDSSISVTVSGSSDLNAIIDSLRKNSILITEIIKQRTSLEDLFIQLITDEDKGKADE